MPLSPALRQAEPWPSQGFYHSQPKYCSRALLFCLCLVFFFTPTGLLHLWKEGRLDSFSLEEEHPHSLTVLWEQTLRSEARRKGRDCVAHKSHQFRQASALHLCTLPGCGEKIADTRELQRFFAGTACTHRQLSCKVVFLLTLLCTPFPPHLQQHTPTRGHRHP